MTIALIVNKKTCKNKEYNALPAVSWFCPVCPVCRD